MRCCLNKLGVVFLIILVSILTAVSCNQESPAVKIVSLPPTTTAVPRPQTTPANRPPAIENATALPVTATITATATTSLTTYTIQPGDTLFIIGNRFAVSVEELTEANDLDNPNDITAGQTLLIPEQAAAETAVPPAATLTATPPPTATALSQTTPEGETGDEGTAVPPDNLEPTGRLELTHPFTMMVEESGVITVEIIADPELATIGQHDPHVTGVIRIDADYIDGERARYEQTIELFPLMSAELNAPAFDVFPSGGNNVRLPRVISTTLPAVWTWDIIATTPGETQIITVNLYKEPEEGTSVPILTNSITRNIQVMAKSRWSQIADGLADNVLLLLGTGGPLGLLLAFVTYRASKENERLKKEVAYHQRQRQQVLDKERDKSPA